MAPPGEHAHTIVVSDLHLTEAEPLDPRRPLWKRFKRKDLFLDERFARLLEALDAQLDGTIELVFNGDTFDFDSVLARPERPDFPVNWLERLRGLAPEAPKSVFKMGVILRDHHVWVRALRQFLLKGHRAVFVVGNHDLELLWPEVQEVLVRALNLPEDRADAVRFCSFFTIDRGTTLITHGHQLDPYCACPDPLHPLIRVRGRARIRMPFGNLAGKLMLNGMGLFNPHVDDSFIRPLRGYITFFFRYVARVQPLLAWTWLWGAAATLVVSLRDGFLPAIRDPFTVEERVGREAERARTAPEVVRRLQVLAVHPAIFNPWRIARELWLDRAALLALSCWAAFQVFSTLNVFTPVSWWWFVGALAVLVPPVLVYGARVRSEVADAIRSLDAHTPDLARAAGVERVVVGHTHVAGHRRVGGVEQLNTGTWSPAFEDVECTRPVGRTSFVHLDDQGQARLVEWRDPGMVTWMPEHPEADAAAERPAPGTARAPSGG